MPLASSSKDAPLPTVLFALLKQNCECYSEFKIPANRPFSDPGKARELDDFCMAKIFYMI